MDYLCEICRFLIVPVFLNMIRCCYNKCQGLSQDGSAKAERHFGVHSKGRRNLHLSHVTTARTDISTSNLSPAELVWTLYCSQPFYSFPFCNSSTRLLYPSSNRHTVFTGTNWMLSAVVKDTNWDRKADPISVYEVTFTRSLQCIWCTAQSG